MTQCRYCGEEEDAPMCLELKEAIARELYWEGVGFAFSPEHIRHDGTVSPEEEGSECRQDDSL